QGDRVRLAEEARNERVVDDDRLRANYDDLGLLAALRVRGFWVVAFLLFFLFVLGVLLLDLRDAGDQHVEARRPRLLREQGAGQRRGVRQPGRVLEDG